MTFNFDEDEYCTVFNSRIYFITNPINNDYLSTYVRTDYSDRNSLASDCVVSICQRQGQRVRTVRAM